MDKIEIMYMTTLVKRLIGKSNGVNGPTFFKYNGIPLPEYYLKYQYKKQFNKVVQVTAFFKYKVRNKYYAIM